MVVLPIREYEQLREAAEELADVQAYDAAKRQLASGRDELIPARFAERILDGESPVRVWREYRGISVKDWPQAPRSARLVCPRSRAAAGTGHLRQ